MRQRRRLRRASIVAGAGLALLFAVQPAAAAARTDTVFPIPVVWVGHGVTNLPAGDIEYVTASTDPAMPGITRFTGTPYTVHWRNLSTGAADTVIGVEWPSVNVHTGSGPMVATVTPDALLAAWPGLTLLPGAGAWTVP